MTLAQPKDRTATCCSSPERLTILHVTAPARAGGLERVVQALAVGQQMAGHRVHVVTVLSHSESDHPLVQELEAAGVDVHAWALPGRAYIRERDALRDLCRALRPDVVHTHGYRSDVVGGGAVRQLRIPVVSTLHGFTRGRGRGALYEWLQRRAYRKFSRVVVVSEPQVRELEASGVRGDSIRLIVNAWASDASPVSRSAARQKLSVAADAFHVGWVGRLSPEKGADIFLEALAHLTDVPLVASIIGDGPERRRLESKARALGVENRVRWHGLVDQAGRLFSGFDVFVLSSRTEGTPIVLFEAMNAQVPIVASAVGGVPNVVSSEDAILVPSNDAVALAASIRNVFGDPAGARRRAASALGRLNGQFQKAKWLSDYENLYRELISTKFS